MTTMRKKGAALGLSLLTALVLTACGGSDSDDTPAPAPAPTPTPAPQPGPDPTPAPQVSTLKFGVLPDTQGSASGVALHTMRAALDKLVAENVKVVLAIGDLIEDGTPQEYAMWRTLADQYKDKLTFLPIMGNHDIKGIDQDWYELAQRYIPADAQHMPGAEWKNYAWIKDRVLFINLSYGLFERSYPFIESVIKTHHANVDHIVLQTHNSFVGNRYGFVRENIIDGSYSLQNDLHFRDNYDKFRELFTQYKVLFLSGHEHHYSRSLILDEYDRRFTQIITGNAAYKGYESRFGEAEKIQRMVMLKVQNADGAIDLNVPIFTVQGQTMDYKAYYVTHTVTSNADPLKELANPQWKLFDRFTYGKSQCEKVVFPASLPAGMQPSSIHDASYRTSYCASPAGNAARILDGSNRVFNRYDTRTRGMSATPGVSFAGSNTEMLTMMYRYLFIEHANYRPNVNNSQRARLVNQGTPDEEVEVRATTIDLKKHVVLSWQDRTEQTLTDRLVVSGITAQDGIYIDPYGREKDITTAPGLAGSYGDGSETAKAPYALPAYATKTWALDDARRGDDFVLAFRLPAGVTADNAALARYDAATGAWQPLASAACVSKLAYDASFLTALPADLDAGCASQAAVVGVDAQDGAFWARVNRDGMFAIVARQ